MLTQRSDTTDEALARTDFRRAVDGEAAAFAAFLGRFERPVIRSIHAAPPCREPESVFETVFLRSLTQGATFAGREPLETWLDALVRESVAETRGDTGGEAPALLSEAIGALIEDSGSGGRVVLRRVMIEGMTPDEVAESLGVTAESVRGVVATTIRRVAGLLGGVSPAACDEILDHVAVIAAGSFAMDAPTAERLADCAPCRSAAPILRRAATLLHASLFMRATRTSRARRVSTRPRRILAAGRRRPVAAAALGIVAVAAALATLLPRGGDANGGGAAASWTGGIVTPIDRDRLRLLSGRSRVEARESMVLETSFGRLMAPAGAVFSAELVGAVLPVPPDGPRPPAPPPLPQALLIDVERGTIHVMATGAASARRLSAGESLRVPAAAAVATGGR